MVYSESSVVISRQGHALESVHGNGLHVSLLASGDGVDVIHHKLDAGSRWALAPQIDWTGLEFVYVLHGELVYMSGIEDVYLTAGDRITANDINDHAYFHAKTDTEFLYVSSRPVFHVYSNTVKKLTELAVAVEHKDDYTAEHCHRIKNMSLAVGEKLKLPTRQLHILGWAAFFHDVGKIRIQESILNKPGMLDVEEWEIMRLHPIYGKAILEETGNPILRAAGLIVEQHHERYDGKGYPYGLCRNEIHICAAIISVVDSFDAITSDRVYRPGLSKEEAIREIQRHRGTMYHPDVVDAFLELI